MVVNPLAAARRLTHINRGNAAAVMTVSGRQVRRPSEPWRAGMRCVQQRHFRQHPLRRLLFPGKRRGGGESYRCDAPSAWTLHWCIDIHLSMQTAITFFSLLGATEVLLQYALRYDFQVSAHSAISSLVCFALLKVHARLGAPVRLACVRCVRYVVEICNRVETNTAALYTTAAMVYLRKKTLSID